MLLADHQIRALCTGPTPMISPFVGEQVRHHPVNGKPVISYGLSSYGYDIRLGYTFLMGKDDPSRIMDPKKDTGHCFDKIYTREPLILEPHSFLLAESIETFQMPDDVTGICLGKSTYARCATVSLMTPLEAGWPGVLTLEIKNHSGMRVKLYPGEGLTQILFWRGEFPPEVTYAQRKGKYAGQTGVTTARV